VIDVDALRVVATVAAELGAGGMGVDTARQRAYCANFLADSITVIDCESFTAIDRIVTGRAPCAVVVNPLNDSLYVVNSSSDNVMRIDLATGQVAAEIAIGRGPVGINASLSGDRIYTGNRAEGTASVIGASDDREWARFVVGEAPAGCVVDPKTGRLLVSNAGSASVTVIEDLLTGPAPASGTAHAHPLVGHPLPPFELLDLRTGKLRHSREWSERKYILNFFASW
jgi:YVTN family beta-propeller protein